MFMCYFLSSQDILLNLNVSESGATWMAGCQSQKHELGMTRRQMLFLNTTQCGYSVLLSRRVFDVLVLFVRRRVERCDLVVVIDWLELAYGISSEG